MSTIGQRIKLRREELGLSQEELGKRLGYKSRSSINKIELDQRNLTQSKIKSIADALETTPSYIMGWEETTAPTTTGIKIPVLGRVAAGIPVDAIEDVLDWEEIPQSMAATGEYFGLKIKGDSMLPDIKSGDVVIVRRQEQVENGEIAIVLINGDEATAKKVKHTESGIMLIPNNPSFEPMFFSKAEITTKPVQIIGRVVELRRTI